MITVIAKDKAAQRKVFADIFPRWGLGFRFEAFLDFLEGCKRDQAFVLSLSQGNIPALGLDISRIGDVREHIIDVLIADMSV
ncbi:hypothetical protein SLH49_12955 [Cognatiyoonia sp. IB215446]|nr:hypothetical protein [Cognatiyoonia sp. IB215446]MDX8348888.1 hypothetical protein [Cognatiyoonia sp. IB215446]